MGLPPHRTGNPSLRSTSVPTARRHSPARPCRRTTRVCSSIAVNPRDRNRVAFGTARRLSRDHGQRLSERVDPDHRERDQRDRLGPGRRERVLRRARERHRARSRPGAPRHLAYRQPGPTAEDRLCGQLRDRRPGHVRGGGVHLFAPVDSLAVSPADPNLLFAGTKYGIFRSTNRGQSWSRFGDDFPATWVSYLLFSPDGSKLRAATWGRGMWEINPLGDRPARPLRRRPTSPTARRTRSPDRASRSPIGRRRSVELELDVRRRHVLDRAESHEGLLRPRHLQRRADGPVTPRAPVRPRRRSRSATGRPVPEASTRTYCRSS